MQTAVTKRGQTVIPAAIRKRYQIGGGARLVWLDDGETIRIVPTPADPIAALRGPGPGGGIDRTSAQGASRGPRSAKKGADMAKPTAPSALYLLDTSALLTFIEDEPGSDRVEEVLKDAAILLPWPVLMEIYYITLPGEGPRRSRRASLRPDPSTAGGDPLGYGRADPADRGPSEGGASCVLGRCNSGGAFARPEQRGSDPQRSGI